LQNPRTGAFMDDTYPYCTYEGPTGNVLLHIIALAQETGQPVQLKYPLKFYDQINTPEKLKVYLDDLANIGWLAAKLPESSFHIIRDLASYTRKDDVISNYNLYTFSPEWKQALLEWFYKNQDPQTGYWGPRSRHNGKLLKLDLHNTGSIVKSFVNDGGQDRYAEFPLRYKDKMFATTLTVMSIPPPVDDDLDDWHAWTLQEGKGIMLLTRYIWNEASVADKEKARKFFEDFVRITFEKYYLPAEGAFSYYPGAQHATLDGTGSALGNFDKVGAFLPQRQKRLWGDPEKTCANLGSATVSQLTQKNFDPLTSLPQINSVRFYTSLPETGNYTAHATMVFYPRATFVLDMLEFVPKIKNWIDTTSQSLGNWTSREEVLGELAAIKIEPVPVFGGQIPLEQANRILTENKTLVVIGFDALQVPRCKVMFRLPES
jgi:hypothetical protein